MKRSVVLGVVGLAVVAVGGGLTGCAESPAAGHAPAPVAVVVQSPVAANESAPASPRQTSVLDLSSKLRFTQSGAVMTVMRHSAEVASVKLTSATYTDSTAHAVFTVTSRRGVRIDTSNFRVLADDGDFSVTRPKVTTLPAGSHRIKVDATGLGLEPRGFGWDTANGDSGATWLRS